MHFLYRVRLAHVVELDLKGSLEMLENKVYLDQKELLDLVANLDRMVCRDLVDHQVHLVHLGYLVGQVLEILLSQIFLLVALKKDQISVMAISKFFYVN